MWLSPPPYFEAREFDRRIELIWQIPESPDYIGCLIKRSMESPPITPDEGIFVYSGNNFQLIGLESDRGLENGTTYFYSIFSLGGDGSISAPRSIYATPLPHPSSPNLVKNPHFSEGIEHWDGGEKTNYSIEHDGKIHGLEAAIKLAKTKGGEATLTQKVKGLTPGKLYSFTFVNNFSVESESPILTVSGKIQGDPIVFKQKGSVGYWQLRRSVFWTVGDEVTITLHAPKAGSALITQIALQEGLLPMPEDSLDPHNPFQYPQKGLILPKQGTNMVSDEWSLHRAEQMHTQHYVLHPTEKGDAYLVQQIPFYLKAPSHTLRALVKVEKGKKGFIYLSDPEINFFQELAVSGPDWQQIEMPINVPWARPEITISAPKGQGGDWEFFIKEIQLLADGGEWLPMGSAHPLISGKKRVWDFTTEGLNPDEWLVLNGKNSKPENLKLTDEGVVIRVYGNLHEANPRQAAMLFTRDYLASGRYDVWMRVDPIRDSHGKVVPGEVPLGCSFAIFPFSEFHYLDGEPQWYDQPEPNRNVEIDIEIPTEAPKNQKKCPIAVSWKNGRLNSWGGQWSGYTPWSSQHQPLPKGKNAADGQFHQYTIIWNSGHDHADGTRTPGTIEWYVDGVLWGSEEGAEFGFDHIPFFCGRFFIGVEFPSTPYGPANCALEGWAGNADWYEASFTIQKVAYTPLVKKIPLRDSFKTENSPLLIWNPARYPKIGS